jgi:hypothetical protein
MSGGRERHLRSQFKEDALKLEVRSDCFRIDAHRSPGKLPAYRPSSFEAQIVLIVVGSWLVDIVIGRMVDARAESMDHLRL